MTNRGLSEKSRLVLSLIAEGRGYDHIVNTHSDISYFDIFRAAEEALWLSEPTANVPSGKATRPDVGISDVMARAKEKSPQAYTPWTKEDEAELAAMHASGATTQAMAEQFQRQPGGIRSRLRRLGIEAGGDL